MSRLTRIGAVVGVLGCAAFVAAQAVPERLMTVKEDNRPARQCRVLKSWKDKDGNKVSKVQAVDNGEMLTVIVSDNSMGYTGTSRGGSTMKVLHHGQGSQPSTTTMTASAPRPRPTYVASRSTHVPVAVPMQSDETPAPRMEAKATPAPITERFPMPDTRSNIVKAQAPVETPVIKSAVMVENPPAPKIITPSLPPAPPVQTVIHQPMMPPAPPMVSEPVMVEEKPRTGLLNRIRGERTEVTTVPIDPAPPEVSGWARRTGVRQTVPSPMMQPGTGMASWEAASSTPLPEAPPAPPVMAPAMPRVPPMMMSQSGVPDGMGNAFTKAGTSRPIPTDMARVPHVPNGLQGGNMGGAEARPMFPLHQQQMAMAMQQPPMPPAMMPSPMPAPAPAVAKAEAPTPLKALRDSLMPSEREMAADQLSKCNWKTQPEVVDGLLSAAKSDPAPTVRVACIRSLAKMKANTTPVVTAVSALKDDSDIRVRQEVEQAMHVLSK